MLKLMGRSLLVCSFPLQFLVSLLKFTSLDLCLFSNYLFLFCKSIIVDLLSVTKSPEWSCPSEVLFSSLLCMLHSLEMFISMVNISAVHKEVGIHTRILGVIRLAAIPRLQVMLRKSCLSLLRLRSSMLQQTRKRIW